MTREREQKRRASGDQVHSRSAQTGDKKKSRRVQGPKGLEAPNVLLLLQVYSLEAIANTTTKIITSISPSPSFHPPPLLQHRAQPRLDTYQYRKNSVEV